MKITNNTGARQGIKLSSTVRPLCSFGGQTLTLWLEWTFVDDSDNANVQKTNSYEQIYPFQACLHTYARYSMHACMHARIMTVLRCMLFVAYSILFLWLIQNHIVGLAFARQVHTTRLTIRKNGKKHRKIKCNALFDDLADLWRNIFADNDFHTTLLHYSRFAAIYEWISEDFPGFLLLFGSGRFG